MFQGRAALLLRAKMLQVVESTRLCNSWQSGACCGLMTPSTPKKNTLKGDQCGGCFHRSFCCLLASHAKGHEHLSREPRASHYRQSVRCSDFLKVSWFSCYWLLNSFNALVASTLLQHLPLATACILQKVGLSGGYRIYTCGTKPQLQHVGASTAGPLLLKALG